MVWYGMVWYGMVQAEAMLLLYNSNKDLYRLNVADRTGKELLTGPVAHTEVVNWMGVRADMLDDGEALSPAKANSRKIQQGVIVRIAANIPKEVMKFLTDKNNSSDEGEKADTRSVLQQRYMTAQGIWDTPQTVCFIPFVLFVA